MFCQSLWNDKKMSGQEINTIWNNFRSILIKFIQSKVSDENLAKDILQDVFLKLVVAEKEGKEIRNVQAWLFQVSRNTINDHFRELQKSPEKEVMITDSLTENQLNGCVCDLTGFVIKHYLPEIYGRPLIMSDIEKIPQKDIAQELGISLSGAKSRIQRGRKMLKELILKCVEITYNRQGEVSDFRLKANCELPGELILELEKNKISF